MADDRNTQLRVVVGGIIVVLLFAFVMDNRDPVRVGFVLWDSTPRLIFVLLFTALLGGIVGFIAGRATKG